MAFSFLKRSHSTLVLAWMAGALFCIAALSLYAFAAGLDRASRPAHVLSPIAPPGPAELLSAAAGEADAIEKADAAARRKRLAELSAALSWPRLSSLDPESVSALSSEYFALASSLGEDPASSFDAVMPPERERILATFSDKDIEKAAESGKAATAFGRASQGFVRDYPAVKKAVPAMIALLDEYAKARGLANDGFIAREPVNSGDYWLPSAKHMRVSHQNALDVFFTWVRSEKGRERGPTIRSATYGVVVATANDWQGSGGENKYLSGGLTPRAGNGALVYEPSSGRILTYLHFFDVAVSPGQIVSPGDILGRGGNTGATAALPDHGEHVHIEIMDLRTGAVLDSYTVRLLLFGR